jgi:hypothetical protein
MKLSVALCIIGLLTSCSPTTHPDLQPVNVMPPSAEVATSGPTPPPVGEDTTGPIATEFDPQQFAIDTMNYIMTFEMARPDKIDKSPYDYDAMANDCLSQKKGICGDRAIAMIMTMRRNNPSLPARIVGIFGLSGFGVECHASHACMEVYYSGSWHFFDPTFGVYFTSASGRVIPFDEVIKNAYTPEILTRGYGPASNRSLIVGFAQSHYGLVYGEEEYKEFTKYLFR